MKVNNTMNTAQRIITQNANNPETVYASVRLNRGQYLALREYLHIAEGSDVTFPYGSTLIKRGYGWYRLFATNERRGIDKVRFAISVIKRCLKEYEEKEEKELIAETQRLLIAAVTKTQPIAYTSDGFMYASGQRPPQPAALPSINKLLALQAKFKPNHNSK